MEVQWGEQWEQWEENGGSNCGTKGNNGGQWRDNKGNNDIDNEEISGRAIWEQWGRQLGKKGKTMVGNMRCTMRRRMGKELGRQ